MTYLFGLDEVESAQLLAEIKRRDALIKKNRCDYCTRSIDLPPCRFPDRHKVQGPLIVQHDGGH